MLDFERIEDLCQRLAMGTIATLVPHVADEAARKDLSFPGILRTTAAGRTPPALGAQPRALNANSRIPQYQDP